MHGQEADSQKPEREWYWLMMPEYLKQTTDIVRAWAL